MSPGLKRGHVDEADVRLSKRRPISLEGVKEHPFASLDGGSENDPTDDEDNAPVGEKMLCQTAIGQLESAKAHKPPTGVEVRAIKAAQELFLSSSFKLQVDALLPNIRPKDSRKPPLERFLFSLHAYLSSLPSVEPQHPLAAAGALADGTLFPNNPGKKKASGRDGTGAPSQIVSVPYSSPTPTEDANWKVSFEKPSNIAIVGSWINDVAVKSPDGEPWVVDLAVEMPPGLFQEKDYMNYRFFHKRAFYLAVIAKYVTDPKSHLNVDAFYESKRGDPRLTTLILRPKHDNTPTDFSKLNAVIRIIPTLPASSPIRQMRCSPTRSNFRVHLHDLADSDHENRPTPSYNAVLMLASSPLRDVLSVNTLKNDIPAYHDALSLLRVWGNQRGYGEGRRTCIRGFEGAGPLWSALLELSVRGGEPRAEKTAQTLPLRAGLSSYQLFKAVLDLLSRHDFSREPLFVKSTGGHLFAPEEYSGRFEAILVDSSSCVNVLAGVPLASVEMLKHDARATLEVLDGASGDPFSEAFLRDHRDLTSRFDCVLAVDLSSAARERISLHDVLENGSFFSALLTSLSTLLREALGPRAKAFAILHRSSRPRPLSQGHPTDPTDIFIGLVLDQERAFRLVDQGPSATEPRSDAQVAFCELWGNKAEVRRFQDGSITESVVWHVRNSDERAHIPVMIVRHILGRHFGVCRNSVTSWQPEFDKLLRLPPTITSHYRAAGFKAAFLAFQTLAKSIKQLGEELPLTVTNISPVAPELRYTSVFAPVSVSAGVMSTLRPCARYIQLISLNLEFEKSARWPDDLIAIQMTKMTFLERLAQLLAKSTPGLHARVACTVPTGVPPTVDHAQLEVTTPDGWTFALRIWHDREATLLDRILHSPPATLPSHDLENARMARRLYTQRFIAAPRHHRSVATLHHRFVAFSGTVRLVKRWLAAHWLLRLHVGEEAVEVLCATVFIGVGPAHVPSTRERGFACVVRLLRDWDWSNGMTIPLDGESEPGPDIYSSAVPGAKGVWVLRTEADPDGRMWTVDAPNAVAAHRIGVESGVLDVLGMFVHPEDDYDFVVKLRPAVLPRYFQNVTADTAVWTKSRNDGLSGEAPARPGFDPAEKYLDDLTRIYADTAKFFYDPLGGDRFGGIWDPSITKPLPFRVMNHFSSMPVKPPESYFTLYPRPATSARSAGALATARAAAPAATLTQAKDTLISRFSLESRLPTVDAPPPSEQDVDGGAVWEDTAEKREASLRERKAQMILAARQCVQSIFCTPHTNAILVTQANVSCTSEAGGHLINIAASSISFLLAYFLPTPLDCNSSCVDFMVAIMLSTTKLPFILIKATRESSIWTVCEDVEFVDKEPEAGHFLFLCSTLIILLQRCHIVCQDWMRETVN
ncbi:Nrap protein-domain-containing protein [Lactarius quietus]|nr:Nrap protein-domain-containing protein [Lactarius quietus]